LKDNEEDHRLEVFMTHQAESLIFGESHNLIEKRFRGEGDREAFSRSEDQNKKSAVN